MIRKIVRAVALTATMVSLLGNSTVYASSPIDVRDTAMNGMEISSHLGETLGNFKLTGYCSCNKCNVSGLAFLQS